MTDRPPSGTWRGYYLYQIAGIRHGQKLYLTFGRFRINGNGIDGVGPFSIQKGFFDPLSGKVYWIKRYHSHDVYIRGFYENSCIWGVWQIGTRARGGFRIWPDSEE